MESASAAVMAKKLNGLLASVKAGVEIQGTVNRVIQRSSTCAAGPVHG